MRNEPLRNAVATVVNWTTGRDGARIGESLATHKKGERYDNT